MSQSPTNQSEPNSLLRYRQGWKALNRLLHEDRSFSGNEKNCAFLNMRDGKFAGISSVSGLDYNDDSRALALCDWDFDGKQDLWTTARTAPRVRFLRNQNESKDHFVAVQLRGNGTTTNRDGIGARVEIVTANQNEKSIRTLHAGEGFLTQSSRWLHFGLGTEQAITDIRVSWPGGEVESFGAAQADGFYLLQQESGKATQWNSTSTRKPLQPATQPTQASSQITRIIPPYRLPLPYVVVAKRDNESRDASKGKVSAGLPSRPSVDPATQRLTFDRPMLLSVWSVDCANCIRELSEWSQHASEFKQKGLDVVALNADNPQDEGANAKRIELLKRIGFAFPDAVASASSIRQLDYFQRSIMDRWQAMPVPCSFLLDGLGRVVAIYKGPVELPQIWDDLALLDASPEQLRIAGLPFAGRWAASVPQADPTRVSSQLVDHVQVDGAIDYLQQFVDTASRAGSNISDTQRADVQFVRAVLLESQGRSNEAHLALEFCSKANPNDLRIRKELAKSYLKRKDLASAARELQAALGINPNDEQSRQQVAAILLKQGKFEAATKHFKFLLKQDPKDVVLHFQLATSQRKSGKIAEAINSYATAVKYKPDFVLAANNLAWILATHPDAKLRNGKLATSLAERMCKQTEFKEAELIDTLSVAYAEAGEFEKAVQATERAIALLKQSGDSTGVSNMEKRKQLFLQRQPYHEAIDQ